MKLAGIAPCQSAAYPVEMSHFWRIFSFTTLSLLGAGAFAALMEGPANRASERDWTIRLFVVLSVAITLGLVVAFITRYSAGKAKDKPNV